MDLMKFTGVALWVLGILFLAITWSAGLFMGAAFADDGAREAAPADQDEKICSEVAEMFYLRGNTSPSEKIRRNAGDFFVGCVKARREERRASRDSLEAEYLERLQDCNDRAQEAYEGWMACAYPDLVELEERAHAGEGRERWQ